MPPSVQSRQPYHGLAYSRSPGKSMPKSAETRAVAPCCSATSGVVARGGTTRASAPSGKNRPYPRHDANRIAPDRVMPVTPSRRPPQCPNAGTPKRRSAVIASG